MSFEEQFSQFHEHYGNEPLEELVVLQQLVESLVQDKLKQAVEEFVEQFAEREALSVADAKASLWFNPELFNAVFEKLLISGIAPKKIKAIIGVIDTVKTPDYIF